ncbi:SpoIID/LytB domain-containing protein [candidate division KSB1 bacterium]|nr:SpoIID/LytB domain-containing protein [candidate division KSB1 bacterium]
MKTNKLYKITKQVPRIKIGIIQSAPLIQFSCDSDFQFRSIHSDEIFFEGIKSVSYCAKVVASKPAIVAYQIRLFIYKDLNLAEEKTIELNRAGYHVHVRQVGVVIQMEDSEIDNYDYWIVSENIDTREQAEQILADYSEFEDAFIIEEIKHKATGTIEIEGHIIENGFIISPLQQPSFIHVSDVTIGIEFHWQHKRKLSYYGELQIGFNNDAHLVAINIVDLETYLTSVNSSEMTSDCPMALLEAQTIAARSTVLATMGKHHYNTDFHLCSDDHCQCYHGAIKVADSSRHAVENTFGEVMMYGTEVCDARYSKICGGIIERYDNVWDNREVPYLIAGIDSKNEIEFPADSEEKAKRLIDGNIDVFCNTSIHQLPPKLAELYSTQDLFRWTVVYGREKVEELLLKKMNIDVGELKDIVPISRGASGRLIYVDFVGSDKTVRVGKELKIRRVLSDSHLYSSCFYVEKVMDQSKDKVKEFILKGAGWGHGVGLCQVGATVMASEGYSYPDILTHYFKNIKIVKLY